MNPSWREGLYSGLIYWLLSVTIDLRPLPLISQKGASCIRMQLICDIGIPYYEYNYQIQLYPIQNSNALGTSKAQ